MVARILMDNLMRPQRLPVAVAIGGAPAEVLYAGSAPGQVPGLFQINARVPDAMGDGPTARVEVSVGTSASVAPNRDPVTVFVRR
jgi:uncharacterized protein (TIGR03437 family)